MRLHPIETGNFKLDGGAMFGVVPKKLWERTNPADADNRIELAARCLLVENGDRLTLIDTGLGDKQSEKFFSHYALWGPHSLDRSLAAAGFHRDDVTDVFMTHLHFDHCGGSVQWNADRTGYEPAFKNARFWSNRAHWAWATEPNARERASFLNENLLPMEESGQLHFVELDKGPITRGTELGFDIICVDGHTEKQMLPVIEHGGQTVVFAADLIPTTGHIPLPYVMGYDVRPLQTLVEKARFLNEALEKDYLLFLEHDPNHEICQLKPGEKGPQLDSCARLSEVFRN